MIKLLKEKIWIIERFIASPYMGSTITVKINLKLRENKNSLKDEKVYHHQYLMSIKIVRPQFHL